MNKSIKKLITEVMVLTIILVITGIMWPAITKDYQTDREYLAMYNKNVIIDNIDNIDALYSSSDMNDINITLRNTVNDNSNYKLYLGILKTSTVNINNLMLNTNKLTDTYSYQDNDYYYYLVDNNHINKSSYKDIAVNLWLDETNEYNQTLSYIFNVEC